MEKIILKVITKVVCQSCNGELTNTKQTWGFCPRCRISNAKAVVDSYKVAREDKSMREKGINYLTLSSEEFTGKLCSLG